MFDIEAASDGPLVRHVLLDQVAQECLVALPAWLVHKACSPSPKATSRSESMLILL